MTDEPELTINSGASSLHPEQLTGDSTQEAISSTDDDCVM